jgi:hypothetical protein
VTRGHHSHFLRFSRFSEIQPFVRNTNTFFTWFLTKAIP